MSGIVKPLVGSLISPTHPLGPAGGLVGCWLLNENSGNLVNDYSGQGNHGTLTGFNDPPIATSGWNAGPHGGVLVFDGSNDLITTNVLATLPNTIIVKFKLLSMPTVNSCLFGGYAPSYWNCAVYFSNPSGPLISIYAGGVGGANYSGFRSIIYNTWYVAAFVSTNVGITVYFDGKMFGYLANGGIYSNILKWIGGGSPAAYYPFNGVMSHLSHYNRALSADEVSYLNHDPFCMFPDRGLYEPWMRKHISAQEYYRNLLAGGYR